MSSNAISVMIIWSIIALVLLYATRQTLFWLKQPVAEAEIIGRVRSEERNHGSKVEHWDVKCRFDHPVNHTEETGMFSWREREEPCVGQKIMIRYDEKHGKCDMENAFTMHGLLVLTVILLIWGIVCTVAILSGINLSRDPRRRYR